MTLADKNSLAVHSKLAACLVLFLGAVQVLILAFAGLEVSSAAWDSERARDVPRHMLRAESRLPLELVAVESGSSRQSMAAREVVVQVGPTGRLMMGGGEVRPADLPGRLRELVEHAGPVSLTIRADAQAPYEPVAQALAAGRSAGVESASLLVVE